MLAPSKKVMKGPVSSVSETRATLVLFFFPILLMIEVGAPLFF